MGMVEAAVAEKPARSSRLEWSIGGYTSQIDRRHGVEETQVYTLPISLKWRSGLRWAKVAASWVSVSGPGNVDDTAGSVLDREITGSESGIGDLYLSAGQLFPWSLPDRHAWLQVSGKFKVPTADLDKGLGTGEPDTTLTGALFYPLQPSSEAGGASIALKPRQLYAKLSYLWKGDPEAVALEDRPSITLGSTFSGSDRWRWGMHWQWEGPTVGGADPRMKLFFYATTYLSIRIGRQDRNGQAHSGFNKIAPFLLLDAESPKDEIGLGVTFGGTW